MTTITEKDVENVLTSILQRSNDELLSCKEDELDGKYFHFKWNDNKPDHLNLYEFYQCLYLFSSSVRKWEEHHNGSCCVVERVRDKYLMPKIKEFLFNIKKA